LPKSKQGKIEGGKCSKQAEAISLRLKEAIDMTRESLEEYALTKDRHHLVKGLELIEDVIEADKGYALGYYWKATILAKLKEYKKASLALDQGIRESIKVGDEEVVSLYFLRGLLKQKAGRNEDALGDYEKTMRIYQERLKAHPRNWDALINCSLVLALMDRREEAIKLIKQTIAEYPEEAHLKQLLEDIVEFNAAIYLERL
jgi:tetratricopeptide (TPR) repeat protein